MLFRAAGPQLAIVGPDKKIQLRAINIGRDYGTTLEILGGVTTQDQVVINPSDSLESGQEVNIAQASPGQGEDPSATKQPQTPPNVRQEENLPEQQEQKLQGQPGQQNRQKNSARKQQKGSQQ
jgi:hypothetical protein